MMFDLFSPSSSSTKKRICKDQQLGDYDEDGVNLKLYLAPPCSLDLKLSLLPTRTSALLPTHRNPTLEDGPKRNEGRSAKTTPLIRPPDPAFFSLALTPPPDPPLPHPADQAARPRLLLSRSDPAA
ncbi:hypothetical protein FCM35_KLT16248 [Carex littledalei]|uniref:Uncharacterized protein n=1 Tax=Carex littledalei TaxID=544730 RepID=A0A833RJ40_9POAL|nr:hypothetical protein FCM35_KLT16248 [Carex littledalei]